MPYCSSLALRRGRQHGRPMRSRHRPRVIFVRSYASPFGQLTNSRKTLRPIWRTCRFSVTSSPLRIFRASAVRAEDEGSAVHGLRKSSQSITTRTTVLWRLPTPRHARAVPVEGAEECSDLLSSLSACLSRTAAIVATGQIRSAVAPVIALALSPDDRALLHQVHEVSDWAATLDRNLGDRVLRSSSFTVAGRTT